MMLGFLSFSLLSLALPLGALAEPHGKFHLNRHHDLAKRAQGDVNLSKRYSSARWSFYDVGLGACGQTNVASDYIVALNSDQFGSGYPGPNCFKSITMTYNGKTATAAITDECPGCPYGGLDLSRGLFTHFADESVGILYGEWYFNDGSSAATTTSTYKWVAPTTTSTTEKATTSTWVAPTSTWVAPTSTWVAPTSTWVEPTSTWVAPTSTWVEPTSTWVAPTTTWTPATTSTSTWTPEPTTSSTKSSSVISTTASSSAVSSVVSSSATSSSVKSSFAVSASASASSVNYSSGAASGLAVPTSAVTTTGDEASNLNSLSLLFINLGGMIMSAANAE